MSGLRVLSKAIACSLAAMPLVACSAFSPSGSTDPKACSNNLTAAYGKLDYAKSKGYSAKVEWAKAEGVLAEATAARESKHYDTCVEKIKEAQPYIDASLK